MVLLKGFRADYAKSSATNLAKLAAHGASAPDGMIPSYPSESAPNQYTLVTGLYPEHHGLVADRFFNAAGERYNSSDPQAREDARWYGGVPLWVLAEQHGLRTACFFWTGCEAAIAGVRASTLPDPYAATTDAMRVEQALRCLRLPTAERPRLLLVALSEVEAIARESGPDSREAAAAVSRADALVGHLRAALAAMRLPVDLIVVSDRGLEQRQGNWIDLNRYADLSKAETLGPLIYPNNEEAAQQIYSRLKIVDSRFEVYRRKDLPKELHASGTDRLGDPVVVATEPVSIRAQGPATGPTDQVADAGIDGLDPQRFAAMRGIFYAEGPDIQAGMRLKPFANIHVYPFIAGLLKLPYGETDGSAGVLSGMQSSR